MAFLLVCTWIVSDESFSLNVYKKLFILAKSLLFLVYEEYSMYFCLYCLFSSSFPLPSPFTLPIYLPTDTLFIFPTSVYPYFLLLKTILLPPTHTHTPPLIFHHANLIPLHSSCLIPSYSLTHAPSILSPLYFQSTSQPTNFPLSFILNVHHTPAYFQASWRFLYQPASKQAPPPWW